MLSLVLRVSDFAHGLRTNHAGFLSAPRIAEPIQPMAGILIQRNGGTCHMKDLLIKLSVMGAAEGDENGQDLIEYALVIAFVAFAATAGMTALAGRYQRGFHNHWQRSNRSHRLISLSVRSISTQVNSVVLGERCPSKPFFRRHGLSLVFPQPPYRSIGIYAHFYRDSGFERGAGCASVARLVCATLFTK